MYSIIGQRLRWSLCWRGITVAKPWILPDRPETCWEEMVFQMNTTSSAMSWTWSLSTLMKVNQPNSRLQTFRPKRPFLAVIIIFTTRGQQSALQKNESTVDWHLYLYFETVFYLIFFFFTRNSWHPRSDPGQSHHWTTVIHCWEIIVTCT